MIIYDEWDEMINKNFAKLMYDIQNILWSYNSIILWNWDTWIQFRNHCKTEVQFNLWSIYITMWDDKTDKTNQNEWNKQNETDRFYQLFQICKNIQISQSYEIKLSIMTVCWADW